MKRVALILGSSRLVRELSARAVNLTDPARLDHSRIDTRAIRPAFKDSRPAEFFLDTVLPHAQQTLHTEAMNTRFIVALSLAAGFMGGFVSRYLEPPPVFAQTPASPREIRAQKFVLVDETGAARGVFGIEENGSPQIEVIAYKGRVFAALFQSWSLVHGILAQSASPGPKKPTLLPVKP